MNHNRLFLALTLLWPACAWAQTAPKAPQLTVDPAAQALLDKAPARYARAKGLRFHLTTTEDGAMRQTDVAFQKPNLLRVHYAPVKGGPEASTFLVAGAASYLVMGKTYRRNVLPANASTLQAWDYALPSTAESFLELLLEGQSMIAQMRNTLGFRPDKRCDVSLNPPTLIDGDVLRGIRFNISDARPKAGARQSGAELNCYFDAQGLLRRVSTRDTSASWASVTSEQFSEQQLDPMFAPDTFQFNAAGLKLASEPKPTNPAEEKYWDVRLQVGAAPFPFSATALGGQKISPANYKGKVLLLDFWATWCGPCVAGLPEIR